MATALETLLANLTDADLPPSVLSEPLKTFEDRNTTTGQLAGPGVGLAFPVRTTAVPRGRIWTNDSSLSAEANRNQYTFSYNPSSIDFSVSWDPTLPLGNVPGSNFGNIHPASPESISFQLLMNRMVEVSDAYQGPNKLLFNVFGTLCDIAVLFRTINGMDTASINSALTTVAQPIVPATDVGWITAALCTVSFGNGDFNWSGFISSIDVNHAKFVDSMTPVLTTVTISMMRTLAAGATGADGNTIASGGQLPTPTSTSSGGQKTIPGTGGSTVPTRGGGGFKT